MASGGSDASRLRVGFIGGGLRGQLFATLMLRHHDVQVVGVHDPSPAASERFAAATGAPRFGTVDELSREGLDAVVVATPDHLHREAALAAVHAARSVLIEKPLATSTVDAAAIRDEARAHGTAISVAYLNRWHPAFARVLADVQDGTLGEVMFRNARLSNSVRVPVDTLSWAADSSPGWFLMPHSLDLVAATAPRDVATVRAFGRRGLLRSHGIDTWDGLQATIGFADGSSANVESLWALPRNLLSPVRFDLEVVGTQGAAMVEDSVQGLTMYGETAQSPRVLVAEVNGVAFGPNALMIDAFVASLRDETRRLPGADEALWVVQLIEAIHRSAAESCEIEVTPVV